MSDTTLLLDTDPCTGKIRHFHILDEDCFAVETRVDVEPIVEQNTAIRNAQPSGWKGDQHWVASIPGLIYFGLLKTWREQQLSKEERQRALHRFLNDPDNACFRTKAGKL